jgi:hypothetical protein
VDGRVKPGHDEREIHFQVVRNSLKMLDEATELENAPGFKKFWIADLRPLRPIALSIKCLSAAGRLGYWL